MLRRRSAVAVAACGGAVALTLLGRHRFRRNTVKSPAPNVVILPTRRRKSVYAQIWAVIVAPLVLLRLILADFPDELRDTAGSVFAGAWNIFTDFIFAPLESVMSFLWRKLSDGILWVWNQLNTLTDQLWSAFGGIITRVFMLEEFVTEAIKTFVRTTFNELKNSLDQAIDQLQDIWAWFLNVEQWVYDRAWKFIGWFYDSVIKPAIAPLLDLAENLVSRLWDIVGPWIDDAIKAALDAIEFAGDVCVKIVRVGLNLALGVADDAIDVLRKAWDFLTWVAFHPIDVLETIATDAGKSLTANNGAEVKKLIDSNIEHVEDLIMDIFGLK